jgi:hypothetical protein
VVWRLSRGLIDWSGHLQGLEEVQGAGFNQDILTATTIMHEDTYYQWWLLQF